MTDDITIPVHYETLMSDKDITAQFAGEGFTPMSLEQFRAIEWKYSFGIKQIVCEPCVKDCYSDANVSTPVAHLTRLARDGVVGLGWDYLNPRILSQELLSKPTEYEFAKHPCPDHLFAELEGIDKKVEQG